MTWVKDALQTGAINEKKAQLYFMEKWYDVFIPSHTGTRCDFVAIGEDMKPLRVQVKTAQYNGPYIQARLDVRGTRYTEKDTDVLVFVLDRRIWVIPIEEVTGKSSICLGKVGDNSYSPKIDFSSYEVH
jgi:hypothetical protein